MRKIGELKGKPIIEGNPNEIKKNQIHYKESDGNITLSERKEDNTLSSVTSGSGSGEGVKEYYYKVVGDAEMLSAVTVFTGISHCILFIENVYVKIDNVAGNYYNGLYDSDFLMGVKALAVTENATTIFIGIKEPDGSSDFKLISIPKGNVNDKLKKAAEDNFAPYEELKPLFDITCQEITKEEYESMITYKPE
jgi:hypothetical protein